MTPMLGALTRYRHKPTQSWQQYGGYAADLLQAAAAKATKQQGQNNCNALPMDVT